MKNLKLLSFLMIIGLFNSCSVDDDYNNNPSLLGAWNLVEVSGTIAGTTDEFALGTIVWNFSTSEVAVLNTNTNDSLQDGFDSGTYDYILANTPASNSICNQTIAFAADDTRCIEFSNNVLIITENIADAVTYKFIR